MEEFSTSNFVCVDAKGAFVTPDSPTVLPSITNKVRPSFAPSAHTLTDPPTYPPTCRPSVALSPSTAQPDPTFHAVSPPQSLMELARDEGLTVEQRPIPVGELKTLKEVAACGTAVVVTPVNKIVYKDEVIKIGSGADEKAIGPVTAKLYARVRAIQQGEEPDKFGWTVPVN